MNIVFFGDSLTFGYGLHSKDRFVNIIKSQKEFNIVNKGVNGDTTTGLLSRIDKDVISISPDICSLLIGTNDFLSRRNVNYVYDNITFIIKELKLNNITPIVCVPPPIDSNLATKLWSKDINYTEVNLKIDKLKSKLYNFCKINNYIFIDFFSLISKTNNNSSLFIDGIHLNPKGNLLLSDYWIKNFNQYKNMSNLS